MSTVAVKTGYTPQDLLARSDEKKYELIDGQLVERHISALSSWVGGEVLFRVRLFHLDHPIGMVWPADNGFQCFDDAPKKVRRPDVSFIRSGRIPNDQPPDGWVLIVPDLVVEVLSRRDMALEVDRKVTDFLTAGVSLVWVINPETRTVRIHRGDGSFGWLTENEELSGEEVLPGFHCRVVDLFPHPSATREESVQP
jgi:Uma2 family endonuclease